jgi:hypothetical protein
MENKEKGSFLYKVAIARKINAVISLVCTFLILVHSGYDALWMFMRGKLPNLPKPLAFILLWFVVIHVVLSIVTAILGSKGKTKKDEKMYAKPNKETLLQRVLAILIVLMLPLHIIGMGNHLNPKILHSILHPIMFFAVYAHTGISFNKALITLGIGDAKLIKVLGIVAKVVCMLLFVASVIGLYFVMYGKWLG